jgi:hypothetical protein
VTAKKGVRLGSTRSQARRITTRGLQFVDIIVDNRNGTECNNAGKWMPLRRSEGVHGRDVDVPNKLVHSYETGEVAIL